MSPDLHHLSGAYAVDALDRDERDAFEHHLSVCDACRAEVPSLFGTGTSQQSRCIRWQEIAA